MNVLEGEGGFSLAEDQCDLQSWSVQRCFMLDVAFLISALWVPLWTDLV